MKIALAVIMLFCCIQLSGCGVPNDKIQIPLQHWKEVDVRIETHPDPPLAGMSEIVAIITTQQHNPAYDLKVSLRTNDAAPWVQAIQDGYIGVYRRVVDLGNSGEAVLQVRLQRADEEKILLFPIRISSN